MKNITRIVAFLALVPTIHAQNIKIDGIFSGADAYSNSETITWYNGHKTEESAYGDFNNQTQTTTIRYGVAELAGGTPGEEYFFLHVEAPLHAKNMIWQDTSWNSALTNTDPSTGLTETDVTSYRSHHETHHSPFSMKLDFKGATDSEKLIFRTENGIQVFEANLAGGSDSSFGLVNFKDSSDYLLDNGLATKALSLARNTTMSFEFQFAVNATANNAIISYARNGLEMHLSPERGLSPAVVPEPAAATLIGLAGVMLLIRRRR